MKANTFFAVVTGKTWTESKTLLKEQRKKTTEIASKMAGLETSSCKTSVVVVVVVVVKQTWQILYHFPDPTILIEKVDLNDEFKSLNLNLIHPNNKKKDLEITN